MSFPVSAQFLFDDNADFADDSGNFDLDFDEDYEYLSDEEFEVSIDSDEYDANDLEISGSEFCIDDVDNFSDFDTHEDLLTEKDYVEVE